MKQFVHGNLERQKKTMTCWRTVFLGTAPGTGFSADGVAAFAPVSPHPFHWSVTSASTAELIVPKISKLHPRTLHITGRSIVRERDLCV